MKLADFLLASTLLTASVTVHAEEPADLTSLKSSLAAERQRIDALAQVAEQAQAKEQQFSALQQENQQLKAEITQLHEQLQIAEGRAANAEAERDQLRTATAKASEAASQSLVALEGNIKSLNDAAAGQAQPAVGPPQVEQPSAPKPEPKRQARAPVKKPAPAPVPRQVETASATEGLPVDQRAVLGGRPAVFSFANLPPERREPVRQLITELHTNIDEHGLITTIPIDSLFPPGSDQLQPAAAATLSKVGQLIKDTGNREVKIIGHGDGLSSAAYDQYLSASRAGAVREYLISHGAVPTRLAAEGVGDAKPVAPNAAPATNRRVEVLILN